MSALAYSTKLASIADDFGTIEASTGCEVEHFFLDSELASFIASLPSGAVLQGGRLRGVLRDAFRHEWPEAVRERRDKGDFEPAFAEFMSALRASGRLERLLEMRGLGDLGIVEPRRFAKAFADFDRAGAAAWGTFWPALSVEAFLTFRGEVCSAGGPS